MADLGAETDRLRFEFLSREVELSFTFTEVARVELDSGELEHGRRSLADARKGYETLISFLADPKHSSRLTGQQRDTLNESVHKLREAIDAVKVLG